MLRYERALAQYSVVHEYYTNGKLDATEAEEKTGLDAQIIKAEDLVNAEHGGKKYEFDEGNSDVFITLVAGEENTITLRYERSKADVTPKPSKPLDSTGPSKPNTGDEGQPKPGQTPNEDSPVTGDEDNLILLVALLLLMYGGLMAALCTYKKRKNS